MPSVIVFNSTYKSTKRKEGIILSVWSNFKLDLKLDQTDKIISLPIQKCVKYFLRYAQVDISELNLEKKPKQLPLPFPLNRVKVKKEQSPTSSKSVLNLFRVIAKEFFLKHAQAGISELKKNQSNYAPSLPLNRVKLKRKIKQYSPSPSPPLPPFSPAPPPPPKCVQVIILVRLKRPIKPVASSSCISLFRKILQTGKCVYLGYISKRLLSHSEQLSRFNWLWLFPILPRSCACFLLDGCPISKTYLLYGVMVMVLNTLLFFKVSLCGLAHGRKCEWTYLRRGTSPIGVKIF